MNWQHYRGKQAKVLVASLTIKMKGKKIKFCFEMVNGLTSMLFGENGLTIGLITSVWTIERVKNSLSVGLVQV